MRAIAFFLMLVGCATPYGPQGIRGGYSEMSLGGGKWLVTYDGNGYTSQATVNEGAFRRAKELCRGDFDLVDNQSSTTSQQLGGYSFDCSHNGFSTDCRQTGAPRNIARHSAQIVIKCKTATLATTHEDDAFCRRAVQQGLYPSDDHCRFAVKHPDAWKCVLAAPTKELGQKCVDDVEKPAH